MGRKQKIITTLLWSVLVLTMVDDAGIIQHADGVVPQQYPPDALVGKDYYRPTGRGAEARLGALDDAEAKLGERGIRGKRLPVAGAFR